MDESRSVASEQSASHGKMECPHCNKDFQVRSLFKHIKLNHFNDFIDSVNMSKCKLNSNPEEPLELTWMKKNDFDEDEAITLYACLSTDKTFLSTVRANAHFKKDKKALTEHKKEMKKLFSDIEKRNKKHMEAVENSAVVRRWRKALEDNDPAIADAYWRNILWYNAAAHTVVQRATALFPHPELHPMYMQYETYNSERTTLQMWIDQLREMDAGLAPLKAAECMDHQQLAPFLRFYEKFVSALLRHLVDSHTEFCCLYSYKSSECIRIMNYTEEFFFVANETMPGLGQN